MPVYLLMVKEGEVIASDRLSSIYFREHYSELLKYIEKKYRKSFPTLKKIFESKISLEPNVLLEESLSFMDFLLKKDREMPRAYFFAVFPKDFNDVLSLILGGSSNIKVPLKGNIYEFRGSFGYATLLKNGEILKHLSEGDEISLGTISVKVFSRSCYDIMERPLKTLIAFSLLASKKGSKIKISSSPTSSIIWRFPYTLKITQ